MGASLFALAKFKLVLFLPLSIKENFDASQGSILMAPNNGINYLFLNGLKKTERIEQKKSSDNRYNL